MKKKGLTALLLISALTLSALIPSAFAAKSAPGGSTETVARETQKEQCRGKRSGEKTAEPENAIGKDAAKAKAFADAGVTAEQADKVKTHVSGLDDGTVIYKVSFTCDGTRYSYQIDAVTGAVIDKSAGTVTEESATESRKHGKKNGEKTAEPENAIGKDAAKAKAFADAGVTAEQAGKVKTHVSELDDGTVIYKVDFTCDGTRYSYQIDAVTGAVIDKSAGTVTEESATESRGHSKRGKSSKKAATTKESAPSAV